MSMVGLGDIPSNGSGCYMPISPISQALGQAKSVSAPQENAVSHSRVIGEQSDLSASSHGVEPNGNSLPLATGRLFPCSSLCKQFLITSAFAAENDSELQSPLNRLR